MVRTTGMLLALLVRVAAGGPHPLALEAMEAEVRGDLTRAVELFRRAAAEDAKDPWARPRLVKASARAMAFWAAELDALARAKRFAELAQAAALAAEVEPNHSAVLRARRAAAAAGFETPALPPAAEGAVAAFPRRSPGGRLRCLGTQGEAFARAEAVVDRGLAWLVTAQEGNGRWDAKRHGGKWWCDVGVTALALRALLARGPAGLEGDRGKAAEGGTAFLESAQASDGCFGTTESQHFHYNHMLALHALAEMAATTGSPARRAALEKGRDFLVGTQNQGAGWRYVIRGGENDTSLTARGLASLCAVLDAGVDVPGHATAGALAWVREMTDPESGRTGYVMAGGSSARPEGMHDRFPAEHTHAMTAAACLVRALLGQDPEEVLRQVGLIEQIPPSARYPDFYYWELGASASAAALGYVPRAWYAKLVEVAEKLVQQSGDIQPCDPWSPDGGRVYATAMVVLALTAPYRETPRAAPGASPTARLLAGGALTVLLSGAAGDVSTGLYVDPGMPVLVTATGVITPGRGGPAAGPEGVPQVKGGAALVKGFPFACLLGRAGADGKPFRIKPGAVFRSAEPGPLVLFCNDRAPDDNEGVWQITLKLEK